jgi:iron complex transport system substrate-binding protein
VTKPFSRLMGLLVLLVLFWPIVSLALSEKDDRGKILHFAQPATRIVSLAPNLTELAFAAGAGGKLVGVSNYSDYPPAAKQILLVGDSGKSDLERILSLKPDLVLAWQTGNHLGDIERLEKLGIPVFVTEPRHLADIPRLIRAIGRMAGSQREAEAAAADFDKNWSALQVRYASAKPLRVFYEIWHQPPMTVNGQHMISDVIQLCGGVNVFADARGLAPTVSQEAVLAANPEVIVASGSLYEDKAVWADWKRFPALRAARQNNFFFIHPDLMQRQTPRMLQGAEKLCQQLESVRQKPR